jgi:hypothetical protein
VNRLAATQDQERNRGEAELNQVRRDIERLIQAIKDGVPALSLKDGLMALEERKATLEGAVSNAPTPVARLYPRLADVYRVKVDDLTAALNADDTRTEAAQAIRGLIDEIRLVPADGALSIELYGELASLLQLANKNPRRNATGCKYRWLRGQD